MKREGWQHGKVRSHAVHSPTFSPRLTCKVVDGFDLPPVTGDCTKVIHKPTNHSKYSGKCRKARCSECHYHPVSKSRDKVKGAYKLKSCDVVLNHRLVSWRVVDTGSALRYTGISASRTLSLLSGSCYDETDDLDDDGNDDMECLYEDQFNDTHDLVMGCSDAEEESEHGNMVMEEEDEDMGFYEVGFVFENLDEEDWCVVWEM